MLPANDFLIKDEQVYSGALSCRGCGWALLARHLADILGKDTVYVVPACCFSIIAGSYPMNQLKANVVHTVFAAAPATATGIRAALDRQGKEEVTVAVLAGDGGTFDIGLQSMSGAAARNENILYICHNNGAYMNTGVQSSTATPFGAVTTTNPVAAYKRTWPKDLMGIIAAHNIPYAATASPAFLEDLRQKVRRAAIIKGFRFLMIDGPCPPGHKVDPAQSIEVARLAVESRLFPLFEIEHGTYRTSYEPEEMVPVAECLRRQGRFRHLFREENRAVLEEVQAEVDRGWENLKFKMKNAHSP
jgi:pyruvate/2-oxoacid:ferredoxin oxidoreductase beta subunit